MKDTDIIEALLNGWHLEKQELERAKQLVHMMNVYLKQQKS